jgi:CO dehydrogenase maturation factor
MMTKTIAVAGKGGTGKTTFAAMTVKYLIERGFDPVLAIDADPSANLNLALGLALYETVGQIREETKQEVSAGTFRRGISKPDWYNYRINECLVEGEGVDLLAMGRPEGPGCYCAANNMLRQCIDRLGSQYSFVVIDNEAGMEHISRQTTRNVDLLFIISDPSQRGLIAAQHIERLARSLDSRIGQSYLVLNNVVGELPEAFQERVEEMDVTLKGILPRDAAVQECDLLGRPLVQMSKDAAVYHAISQLLEEVLPETRR